MHNKSKDRTLLLAFFLGMFGAHRFYHGKKVSGAIQLLITVLFGLVYFEWNLLFINLVWVLVDIVRILINKFGTLHNQNVKL